MSSYTATKQKALEAHWSFRSAEQLKINLSKCNWPADHYAMYFSQKLAASRALHG